MSETTRKLAEERPQDDDRQERREESQPDSDVESGEASTDGKESDHNTDTQGPTTGKDNLIVDNAPPLPIEAPLSEAEDDGWAPIWDETAQAYYFYNRFTQTSQWTNPRVLEATQPAPPGAANHDRIEKAPGTETPPAPRRPHGGYNPAIHGDYDPTAPYAQETQEAEALGAQPADPVAVYAATGAFNRFTGKWQAASLTPENFNDENKSKRQMSAFFDVDAAANSHNGKSLKAERSGKKLTKQELKAFKEKRKEKKEEKRRAWLRD
ncbi:MAG: hypothetical protein MMC33_008075 [Icmadophila ericetorum]|nr:hypothetical protein [Icmadophila ericetorum]